MPATVRISETGRSLLAQLARDANTSMTVLLDAALETYRRHRLLTQAAAAYEALSSDSVAANDYRSVLPATMATVEDRLRVLVGL